MTDAQIGYLLIGAVVAFLLFKRWRLTRSAPIETVYETTFEIFEIIRPVRIIPDRPRRKVGWLVMIAAVAILWAILSH